MDNQPNNLQLGNSVFDIPPALKHLLFWTVIIFSAMWTPGIGPILQQYGPLYPFQSPQFYPWQFISYMFLHAGIFHIGINLFVLYMFGRDVENYLGSMRFLLYFFLCGIGGGLAFILIHSNPVLTPLGLQYASTVGDSAAVSGVLLAFGMIYPDRMLMLLFPPIPMKAKYLVALFIGLEFFNGVAGYEQGVAHFAHLGGVVAGFILIKLWKWKQQKAFY